MSIVSRGIFIAGVYESLFFEYGANALKPQGGTLPLYLRENGVQHPIELKSDATVAALRQVAATVMGIDVHAVILNFGDVELKDALLLADAELSAEATIDVRRDKPANMCVISMGNATPLTIDFREISACSLEHGELHLDDRVLILGHALANIHDHLTLYPGRWILEPQDIPLLQLYITTGPMGTSFGFGNHIYAPSYYSYDTPFGPFRIGEEIKSKVKVTLEQMDENGNTPSPCGCASANRAMQSWADIFVKEKGIFTLNLDFAAAN